MQTSLLALTVGIYICVNHFEPHSALQRKCVTDRGGKAKLLAICIFMQLLQMMTVCLQSTHLRFSMALVLSSQLSFQFTLALCNSFQPSLTKSLLRWASMKDTCEGFHSQK